MLALVSLLFWAWGAAEDVVWRTEILFTPDLMWDGVSLVLERDLAGPIRGCDFIVYSTSRQKNFSFYKPNVWTLRRKREFLDQLAPEDQQVCFLHLFPVSGRFKTWVVADWDTSQRDLYRERYEASLYLQDLVLNKQLLRGSEGRRPWLVYQDYDLFMTNRRHSLAATLRRVGDGLRGDTLEERACRDFPPERYFECDARTQPLLASPSLSPGDVVWMLATETECYDIWLLNSGHQWVAPSRLGLFLFEAIVSVWNVSYTQDRFDYTDQGRVSIVVFELFDLHFDRLRAVCVPMADDLFAPATETLRFVRRFNETRAARHPLFAELFAKHFPLGTLPASEPRYLALLPPRWFNANYCRKFTTGVTQARRDYELWHCGDAYAHANGCNKDAVFDVFWRRRYVDDPACGDTLPFASLDSGDPRFDTLVWAFNETVDRFFGNLSELTDRFQSRAKQMPLLGENSAEDESEIYLSREEFSPQCQAL
eukprot:Gregarina_sp_Pseudo_9__345@NODE_1222_length_1769_cov_12_205780_g1148_i0_p1_GENE_NODE_1222_length_1769_cov_12_205780_g1148_i0NODE_1222_length_1769_cov_12_205780_g1148_i0_p1_ORF_typecomplete_len482_score168_13_NODE_1222_length_1769_cov_12_205780_g1148_i01991644